MARKESAWEAVSLCKHYHPNNLHYQIAKTFLEAGIHVVCEKPSALRWLRRRSWWPGAPGPPVCRYPRLFQPHGEGHAGNGQDSKIGKVVSVNGSMSRNG